MMKQLNFLLNTKELGIERHNVGAVVYCSENVPFKEILEQMPDVTKYLSGFQTPIPKMYFSTFRIMEWEGKTTDSEQYIDLEDETINQNMPISLELRCWREACWMKRMEKIWLL